MKPLEQADRLCVAAAQGWVELGNPGEAEAELEHLPAATHRHPAVLSVRWEICAARRQWETACQFAAALIELDPEEPLGWVHHSYALHELKRTDEARDNLLRVADKFPLSATMRYNLACYECQLGRLEQARQWLERAFRLGDRSRMKAMALEDPDLKPLWPEIGNR